VRVSDAKLEGSLPITAASGRPAIHDVSVRLLMLKTMRCIGLRPLPARSVHCAQPPTAAMQTVSAGPSAKSAQKFTACESERLDWLRPSGRSIFAAEVSTASPSSTAKSTAWSKRTSIAETTSAAAPDSTTAST
jgi:hypothetical protein